jgi:hypothetical protein
VREKRLVNRSEKRCQDVKLMKKYRYDSLALDPDEEARVEQLVEECEQLNFHKLECRQGNMGLSRLP